MSGIQGFMHEEMVTAEPNESVSDVVKRMSKANIGAVLLVENDRLVGMFSERDLLKRVVAEGRDPDTTPVRAVATTEVLHVATGVSLRACAEQLRKHGVRHVPIVEDHRPIGIVSARDFFEKVSDRMAQLLERSRYDEQLKENEDPYDHIGGSYGR